ncbi:MAG: hypothetical protein LBV12_06810 [Puniceicoccales bacterium]|jgi:hypothetical protein|nr:hypothetical protein [Puniceicoccales bacterium]
MATDPSNLPQFHRSAQSPADVEWQRNLLERLRVVCREEMMDVMKALVDSGHITPVLEEKLTSFEGQTKTLQEDVRQVANLSRSALWKAVLITAAICILVCGGGIAALHFLGGAALVNEDSVKSQQLATQQKTQLIAEVQKLKEQRTTLDEELQKMTLQYQALNTEIEKSSKAQQALAANASALEQQLRKLQQLQEQFRFKMVRGETGGAFVEIPAEAKPFDYQGKLYIQVK